MVERDGGNASRHRECEQPEPVDGLKDSWWAKMVIEEV
jgi:hypothetical protein